MMFYYLTIVVLLSITYGQLAAGLSTSMHVDESLGNGFDISQIKIGTSVLTKGATIFKPIPFSCVRPQTLGKSEEKFNYYENAAELVKTFQASAGLTPSFLSFVSLKTSLSGTFDKLDRSERKVSGATRTFYAHSRRDYLDKKCRQELDDEFVRDFKALKKNIVNPHQADSWNDYRYFLRKYGSHYVTQVTYGASVNQYLSAESSLHYTKRNFSAKACLELAGPVHVGVVKAGVCGGISRGEQRIAQSFQMNHKLVALGGSDATRNKVIRDQSPESIKMLLDEGRKYESPILYKYEAITDLLMSRYTKTEFISQAANFKSFVEGFLNFNCMYTRDRYKLVELQKFELDKRATNYPNYVCTVAPEGCKDDSDCHWRGKCKCHGNTCVRHDRLSAWFGGMKISARINNGTNPGTINKFCKYSLSKISCKCERPSFANKRRVVWSSAEQGKKIKTKMSRAIIEAFFKIKNNNYFY